MSVVSNNPNVIPPYAVLPDLLVEEDGRAELTQQIWDQLVTGRDDVDDFIDTYGEDYDLTDDQLAAAFDALRTVRLRQQAEIGAYTSRTIAAFDELNAHGVVARAAFSYCGTCASGEIWGRPRRQPPLDGIRLLSPAGHRESRGGWPDLRRLRRVSSGGLRRGHLRRAQ
nr:MULTISPECIES: hypothetical protein [unclassified Rhodococcus (in: high G+C Gram-positive bacteria)]